MNHEEAVKHVLVQIHAMMEKVQATGDVAIARWADAKEYEVESVNRQNAVDAIAEMAEECMEYTSKAGFEASVLCALMTDPKEKNAVVKQALEEVSMGYSKLLQIHKCLEELIK